MYTVPVLPYSYNALEPFIDEKTMQIHHDKHHGAYVKNVNDALATLPPDDKATIDRLTVEELVQNLPKVPEAIRTKVRNNAGGHANHSLFWTVMAPPGDGGAPSGKLAKAIDEAFETIVAFQEKFSSAGVARFGSGWVWLISERGKLSIIDTPNQDSPLTEAVPAGRQGKTPILGLDVWEHAYYLKYQNLRADYIKAWWNVVNWKEVEKRYLAAK